MIENDPAIAGLLADEGQATGEAMAVADGLRRARDGPCGACVTDGFWPAVVAEARAYLADLGSCCPVVPLSARDWARSAAGGPGHRRGAPRAVRHRRAARRARGGARPAAGVVRLAAIGADAVTIASVASTQAPGGQTALGGARRLDDLAGLPVVTGGDGRLIAPTARSGGMLGMGVARTSVPASAVRGIGPTLVTTDLPAPS